MEEISLFSMQSKKKAPLADRMRPNSLDNFYGQKHILGANSFLRRAIRSGTLGSCVFYGPPGTGKTTLAEIIANLTGSYFVKLNAVASGVSEAKDVITQAKHNFELYGKRTYLILDECHRWSKAQSDSVLEAIEKGHIVFIGTTTENPYISLTKAIVSRCQVFEFKQLSNSDIQSILETALTDKVNGYGNLNIECEKNAISHFAFASNGDVRSALNSLELAVLTTGYSDDKKIHIDIETAEQCTQKKALSIDETEYYDLLSAFCKSLRGSDAEASLYYANRLMFSGVSPLIIARRLIAHASEDVGMADSYALTMALNALTALEKLGDTEGKIPLTHAIIYVCEAPKSNAVIEAKGLAEQDAQTEIHPVPNHLKNNTLSGGTPEKYKYPHSFGGYVEQQYMPTPIKGRVYYKPSNNGEEKDMVRKKQ